MLIRCLSDRQGLRSLQARRVASLRLIALAMFILSFGLLWPRVPGLATHFSPVLNDFLRGACMGLSIGLSLIALIVTCRSRRPQSNPDNQSMHGA
jgi:flagellar biosynthesis protein FliR